MNTAGYLAEVSLPFEGFKPQTMAGAGTGDYMCLKGYDGCLVIIHITQGHASSGAITMDKATTVAGGGISAGITINHWWAMVDTPTTAGTKHAKGAAATSITPSATGTGSSLYVIDVKTDELGAYDCIKVNMALSNAGNIANMVYVPYRARYADGLSSAIDPRAN